MVENLASLMDSEPVSTLSRPSISPHLLFFKTLVQQDGLTQNDTDRQICYDVYGKVLEMDLFEAGFDTEWEILKVPEMGKEEWEGVKRRYWSLEEYKLPTCQFIG